MSAALQVRDQEIPVKRNFVKVVIHVEDCNDHSPAFLSPHYEASISNLAPTGSEVVRVKALDKDVGSNADISYSLHSGGQQEAIFIFYSCSLLFSFTLFTFNRLHLRAATFFSRTTFKCPVLSSAMTPERGTGFSMTAP